MSKRGFLASFIYAYKGIRHTVNTQQNMRFHLSIALLVSIFSYFYKLVGLEWLALMFTITFVIVCEMINTAVENAVDIATKDFNENARVAKDVAAGAVMVASVLAVTVAVILFLKPHRLHSAFSLIFSNIYYVLLFIVVAVLLAWWVFRKSDIKE